jgi:hypothetical protein
MLDLRMSEMGEPRPPFTVVHPGGKVMVKAWTKAVSLTVPALAPELTPVRIGDLPRMWVFVAPGATTELSHHPCCGFGYEGNAYDDDAVAVCVPKTCPEDTDVIKPGLQIDPVCGEEERCLRPVSVRVVADGEPSQITVTGEPLEAKPLKDATYERVYIMPGRRVELSANGETVDDLLLVDAGARYTVWVEAGKVVVVTRD